MELKFGVMNVDRIDQYLAKLQNIIALLITAHLGLKFKRTPLSAFRGKLSSTGLNFFPVVN